MKKYPALILVAILSLTAGASMAQGVSDQAQELANQFSDAKPVSTEELLAKGYFASCRMVPLQTEQPSQLNAIEFNRKDQQIYAQIGQDLFGRINTAISGSHRWDMPEGPIFTVNDKLGKESRSFEARKTDDGSFLFRETVDMGSDYYDRILVCPGHASGS